MQRNFNLIRLSISILTFTLLNAYIRLTWNSNIKKPLRINAPKWLFYMVGPHRLELWTNGL